MEARKYIKDIFGDKFFFTDKEETLKELQQRRENVIGGVAGQIMNGFPVTELTEKRVGEALNYLDDLARKVEKYKHKRISKKTI